MMASVGMLCQYTLGLGEAADRINAAVRACLAAGECTGDMGGSLSTTEAGRAVRERLDHYHVKMIANG